LGLYQKNWERHRQGGESEWPTANQCISCQEALAEFPINTHQRKRGSKKVGNLSYDAISKIYSQLIWGYNIYEKQERKKKLQSLPLVPVSILRWSNHTVPIYIMSNARGLNWVSKIWVSNTSVMIKIGA